jgi:hypothetical protein
MRTKNSPGQFCTGATLEFCLFGKQYAIPENVVPKSRATISFSSDSKLSVPLVGSDVTIASKLNLFILLLTFKEKKKSK